MQTRIRLRRTASSINSFSNQAIENHHLRYGEALYSAKDHVLVIGGSDTTRTISQIQNRFFAIQPQKGNLVYASEASPESSSATSYPTFRKLVPNDLPTGIPASKITGLVTYKAGAGIYISNSTISNSGVRSVATGDNNGTIKVNTNGTSTNVAVKGLGSAAYKNVADFQAPLKLLTFNNSGSGVASGTTYNGNTARTISYNTLGAAAESHTHLYAGSATVGGSATSAVKLQTGRTLRVNLARTSASTAFDGTANITNIGVSGTLAVSNGGTGKASWTPGNILYASSATTLGDEPASDIINSIDWGNLQGWKDTYIWDINTLTKSYISSDILMTSNMDFGFGIPIDPPIDTGIIAQGSPPDYGRWSTYWDYLSSLKYQITIYTSCTASYSGGNITYTLSGGSVKTFSISQPEPGGNDDYIGYNPGRRYCNGTDQASKYTFTKNGYYTYYIVPGKQSTTSYQVTNPTTPVGATLNNPGAYSTDWILMCRPQVPYTQDANIYCWQHATVNSQKHVIVGSILRSQTNAKWEHYFWYKDKNPQGYLSSSGWQTVLAKVNAYTHGKTISGNTATIRLRRGSLFDTICKQLVGSRVGDNKFTFSINFNQNSVVKIPRLIAYGPASHASSTSSTNFDLLEQHTEYLIIDTLNLQVVDLKPTWVATDEIGIESIEWDSDTTCQSLKITLKKGETTGSTFYHGYRYVNEFNRQGDQYYYYAIS